MKHIFKLAKTIGKLIIPHVLAEKLFSLIFPVLLFEQSFPTAHFITSVFSLFSVFLLTNTTCFYSLHTLVASFLSLLSKLFKSNTPRLINIHREIIVNSVILLLQINGFQHTKKKDSHISYFFITMIKLLKARDL
ncbi:hypothetical protein Dimus_027571 [Dionaea muscipula]